MNTRSLLILIASFAVLGVACTPAAPPDPPPPTVTHASADPTVIVYGDSVLSEESAYVSATAALPGWSVVIRDFPGTALCDWFSNIELR